MSFMADSIMRNSAVAGLSACCRGNRTRDRSVPPAASAQRCRSSALRIGTHNLSIVCGGGIRKKKVIATVDGSNLHNQLKGIGLLEKDVN